MFHKLVFSDLTKKKRVKKAFLRSWSGTKTRLKMSDEAAKVQRKTLQDLQKPGELLLKSTLKIT